MRDIGLLCYFREEFYPSTRTQKQVDHDQRRATSRVRQYDGRISVRHGGGLPFRGHQYG